MAQQVKSTELEPGAEQSARMEELQSESCFYGYHVYFATVPVSEMHGNL